MLGNSGTTKDFKKDIQYFKPYEIAIFISEKWVVSIISYGSTQVVLIHYLHHKYLCKFLPFHQTMSTARAGLLIYICSGYVSQYLMPSRCLK